MSTQTPGDSSLVVVGLGYVGLPLSEAAVHAGYQVTGLDLSESVVKGLNNGVSHVDDLSDSQIKEMLSCGFHATTDASAISSADVVVVCVPTPLATDGSPDLAAVNGAAKAIGQKLRPGTLVVLESTTFPGTTEEVVIPLIGAHSGLAAGTDYNVAFSPERVDPGNKVFTIANTPKVVGGFTPACAERAAQFYGRFVERVVRAAGTREAETAKLLENTYRHINIALVNEMARVCHEMGIDVWNVIHCAATKPFGFQAFYPGPGVGGHCIPIDPNYLSYAVKTRLGHPMKFVELAQEMNKSMPEYVVRRIQDCLNERRQSLAGSRILLVGVTYKPHIADQRESPADDVWRGLMSAGAEVAYLDCLVEAWAPDGIPVERIQEAPESPFDLAVVLQHQRGIELKDLAPYCRGVFDARGRFAGPSVERL